MNELTALTILAIIIGICFMLFWAYSEDRNSGAETKILKQKVNDLKFSQRMELQKGPACPAEWQVKTISDGIYYISCRKCGVGLQSGCTPKCLNEIVEP
jgi:ribosomal protein L37AE/L43A